LKHSYQMYVLAGWPNLIAFLQAHFDFDFYFGRAVLSFVCLKYFACFWQGSPVFCLLKILFVRACVISFLSFLFFFSPHYVCVCVLFWQGSQIFI
jgi:hypothetical protein